MRFRTFPSILLAVAAALLLAAGTALAASPSVIWSKPNTSGLGASVGAVAWSPNGSLVASGLSDRWVRVRNATNGAELRAILQPPHSHGVVKLLFSNDNQFLAVGNSAGSTQFRVYQVSGGAFLGQILGSVDERSIIHYAADAQLASNSNGAGQLSKWRLSELPISIRTGSGYQTVTTRFQLSPNSALETALTKSTITVRRVSDGAVLATLSGQATAFSLNSATLAVWQPSPNRSVIYRTSDFAAVRNIAAADPADQIRLGWSPSGLLVGAGYRPFVTADGTWDQVGILRTWRASDGVLLKRYDSGLSLAVTSNVAFNSDSSRFAVGLYNGTTLAANN